jgi:hypothetical protein
VNDLDPAFELSERTYVPTRRIRGCCPLPGLPRAPTHERADGLLPEVPGGAEYSKTPTHRRRTRDDRERAHAR